VYSGEIHITHKTKTKYPYSLWDIKMLASMGGLVFPWKRKL